LAAGPPIKEETDMTHISIHAEPQASRFSAMLSGLFMVATLTITGFLSLAMFAG
jgi:hypothetical protein